MAEKWKAGLSDAAKITTFGWDQTECAEVAAKITAFLTTCTTYETDNSIGNRIAKDEAKGEMVDAMREFANTSIRFNKQMHDEDKLAYGIHPKDTTSIKAEADGWRR